jgi:hypothetical protein
VVGKCHRVYAVRGGGGHSWSGCLGRQVGVMVVVVVLLRPGVVSWVCKQCKEGNCLPAYGCAWRVNSD